MGKAIPLPICKGLPESRNQNVSDSPGLGVLTSVLPLLETHPKDGYFRDALVDFFNPEVLRSRQDINLPLPSVMGIQERPLTKRGQSREMILRREILQAEATVLHSTIGGHVGCGQVPCYVQGTLSYTSQTYNLVREHAKAGRHEKQSIWLMHRPGVKWLGGGSMRNVLKACNSQWLCPAQASPPVLLEFYSI